MFLDLHMRAQGRVLTSTQLNWFQVQLLQAVMTRSINRRFQSTMFSTVAKVEIGRQALNDESRILLKRNSQLSINRTVTHVSGHLL